MKNPLKNLPDMNILAQAVRHMTVLMPDPVFQRGRAVTKRMAKKSGSPYFTTSTLARERGYLLSTKSSIRKSVISEFVTDSWSNKCSPAWPTPLPKWRSQTGHPPLHLVCLYVSNIHLKGLTCGGFSFHWSGSSRDLK
jgi:hypothetical protein